MNRSVLVAIVAGALLIAVAIVVLAGLKRADRRETCLWNLSRIGHVVIAAEPRRAADWDRIGTGRQFFTDFIGWPAPPFPFDPIWFCCPSVGAPTRGRIDFRGPSAPLRRLDRDDPIVADLPGNHGAGSGGNILLRNGSVKSVSEADPAWVRAMATTEAR